jgi:HK97 family phage major capsid protein
MKKSLDLKETRSDLVSKLEGVHGLATSEKRELTKSEAKKVDTMISKIDDLDVNIKRAEKIESELRSAAAVSGGSISQPKADKRYSIQNAINGYMNNNLTGIEKEYHEEAKRSNNITGVGIPTMVFGSEKRNNPQLTSNATGMIETQVGDWAGTLQNKTVLGDLATWMYGLSGDMKLPTLSGTTAGWGTEVANATDAASVVGSTTLQPKKLSSYMDISKMLLAQTNNSVEGVIRDDMTAAIASVLEAAVLGADAGAGATPQGVFNAGTNNVAAAAASYANLLEMEKDLEVANADFGRLAFLTTPGGRASLKNLVGQPGTGSYGQPAWYEDTIDGYIARSTNNVNVAAGGGSDQGLVLGRWDDCVIGQFGNALDIVVDPYTKAISGEVRLVILSFWDVVYRRATSFQYTHIS